MKRRMVLVTMCFALIISLLTSCVDFYANSRPIDQVNTLWISVDPNIWFRVDENMIAKGEIIIDDKILNVEFLFKFGNGVDILDTDLQKTVEYFLDARIIYGECKFRQNKLIMQVITDKVFGNEYETITFIKSEN